MNSYMLVKELHHQKNIEYVFNSSNKTVMKKNQALKILKKYSELILDSTKSLIIPRRMEIKHLGEYITLDEKKRADAQKPLREVQLTEFRGGFLSNLVLISIKNSTKLDPLTQKNRSHSGLCDHSKCKKCTCWCDGKYHGSTM